MSERDRELVTTDEPTVFAELSFDVIVMEGDHCKRDLREAFDQVNDLLDQLRLLGTDS